MLPYWSIPRILLQNCVICCLFTVGFLNRKIEQFCIVFHSQAQEDEERDKIELIRLALARNLSRTIL